MNRLDQMPEITDQRTVFSEKVNFYSKAILIPTTPYFCCISFG